MKNLSLFCIVVMLVGCTCEDHSPTINACTSEDAINDIPWLSDLKNSITNCTCTTSVMQGTYQSKTVYFVLINDPFCDTGGTVVLYNCKGERISTIDVSQFVDDVKIDTILYSCEE